MVFPRNQAPKRVEVSYHYGFSAPMGAGEYSRQVAEPAGARFYRVRQRGTAADEFATVAAAYAAWQHDKGATLDPEIDTAPRAAVIEIVDNSVYEERFDVELDDGESLQLRGAPDARPVLRLLDYRVDQPDPFTIRGGRASRFVLDGLVVTGRPVVVAGSADAQAEDSVADPGDLCDMTIRHCCLVPGWNLDCDCTPERPDEPSLVLTDTRTCIRVEHTILGSISIDVDERVGDPPRLALSDSIMDATAVDGVALSSGDGSIAFASASFVRCTIVGDVLVHAIQLAENSIFTSAVTVARRQLGCVRYCYVPPGSRTPRRYRCQPDLVVAATTLDRARREESRVRPVFTSLRFGVPGYAQLGELCADEIVRGADDESELGCFHDLFQPQRDANLRMRLGEYTPAALDVGIIHAS
jgi:hypothetical protein